jgi:hypothetical protein
MVLEGFVPLRSMASPSQIDSALTLALESQTRALLSELDKRLQILDNKWESRVSTLESKATEAAQSLSEFSGTHRANVEAHLTAADASTDTKIGQIEADLGYRVAALESTVGLYEFWRPCMDASLEDLHSSMDWLRSEVCEDGDPVVLWRARRRLPHVRRVGHARVGTGTLIGRRGCRRRLSFWAPQRLTSPG